MEWIRTSDQMPAPETQVIIATGSFVAVGELNKNNNFWRYCDVLGTYEDTGYLENVNDVTHWMPLPDMPK